jgi:hypothetical protein
MRRGAHVSRRHTRNSLARKSNTGWNVFLTRCSGSAA